MPKLPLKWSKLGRDRLEFAKRSHQKLVRRDSCYTKSKSLQSPKQEEKAINLEQTKSANRNCSSRNHQKLHHGGNHPPKRTDPYVKTSGKIGGCDNRPLNNLFFFETDSLPCEHYLIGSSQLYNFVRGILTSDRLIRSFIPQIRGKLANVRKDGTTPLNNKNSLRFLLTLEGCHS